MADERNHPPMASTLRSSSHNSESARTGAALQLFDPRRGDLSFKIEPISPNASYFQPHRCNYFTILWIGEGRGRYHAGLSDYRFEGPAVLFSNPYQTFFVESESAIQGTALQFHANFFCIETYHEAVGCNGVLFNDIYGEPVVAPDGNLAAELGSLLAQMKREFQSGGLAHAEMLVAFLKVFLIKATRAKLDGEMPSDAPPAIPPVVERLAELIEQNFQTKHSPADYAAALHITPKALGKLVKVHFGRTTTDLIRDRLLKHAKWQLLHTRLSVKEIAWEVGFPDELYFSRLFKRATGFAPTAFREFETAIRDGRNLSM